MNKKGKLIICSAPSGSGKTTLVQHLLSLGLDLVFSISATTRAPRGLEKHGKDYFFLSVDDFKKKIQENAFVEWEEVYEGVFYGTLKAEVNRLLNEGKNVIFDVDVLGGLNLKKYYKENALSLFIVPPSIEELERRLVARATDEECIIAERVRKADYELTYKDHFDKIIINEDLEVAKKDIEAKVSAFIKG